MNSRAYVPAVISALICLSACHKTEEKKPEPEPEPVETVFTATINGLSETKTTIDGLIIKWESSDVVSINGIDYTATPDGADATKATLKKKAGEDPTAPFKAICPSSIYAEDHYELPDTLPYADGKFNIPTYAESETETLIFKNIFAVLKITVANTVTVKSISVSSDLYMNGTFTVSGDKASVADGKASNKTTTLNCGSGVTGTDFYIPVPARNYTGKNLTVLLTKTDGTETMTSSQTATIEIAVDSMYSFDFRKDGTFVLGPSDKKITAKEGVL